MIQLHRLTIAVLLAVFAACAGAADVNVRVDGVRIDAPGVSITFGSRDSRGYYWDGDHWRDEAYWRSHDGHRGERYYTGGKKSGVPFKGDGFCPPGQAKKGNC